MKPEVPKCFEDDLYLYCFCGKCVPKDQELPDDLGKLAVIEIVRRFKKNV